MNNVQYFRGYVNQKLLGLTNLSENVFLNEFCCKYNRQRGHGVVYLIRKAK